MSRVHDWLHPRLSGMPRSARRAALRESTREPFDAFELVGMAGAVVLAASLAPAMPAWVGLALAACAMGVVLVRRSRRALRRMFET